MSAGESFYADDEVSIALGGITVLRATGFEISQSVLQQPASFSVRLGRGSRDDDPNYGPTAYSMLRDFPPNTPFQLFINNNLRMTGQTDGYRATAAGNAATEVSVFGRDVLAPLHDAHIPSDRNFNDSTYTSLVKHVLDFVGIDSSKLVKSAEADRKLKAGVQISQLLPVQTIDEILAHFADGETAGGTVHQVLQSRVGDRWMEFLRKQLDRAGLFLWGAADGSIILSAPNTKQAPPYQITRRRGQARNEVNVVHADLLNDTRPRYTHGVVYGKGGGRKHGRANALGDATDVEMKDLYKFGGPNNARAIVIRDTHVQNAAQAAYLAMRKLAESRRHGFQLVYTMAGLSTPTLDGTKRAVWTPDTMVHVLDEEFGIDGDFWIERTDFRRTPHTTTTLHLIRPTDLIFGTPDFEGASAKTTSLKTKFEHPKTIEQMLGNKNG